MTRTHCPYCALQCGMDVSSGGLISAENLCQKGWTAAEVLRAPDRLTTPLVDGQPATWDDALDLAVTRIRLVQESYGPDGVAVFGGGGLTNEKAYLLGKFARVALRTSQIDYNGRFCMSSAAAAVQRAFGVDRGLPFPAADLAEAETVLLVGANPAETMPPFIRRLRGAKRLIVVDPRLTATARLADLHLQITPGTDLALALGLLHIAVADDLIDAGYIAERTCGFPEAVAASNAYWPERAERITGVPVRLMRETARALARRPAVVLTARGAEQHAKGVDTVTGFINLALALGLPGRPGSGFGTLTGQGNGQGGREHGQKADQLPGYRDIRDPAARAHVARVWGVRPQDLPGPGRSAHELLRSLGAPGGPRALLVFGSNPAVSAPDTARVRRRLRALDFLMVCDVVPSETARLADVVLPVTQWAEENGTMTTLEGRVVRRRRATVPPPGVRSDLDVMYELARRMNAPGDFTPDPERVFAELRRASAGGPADYSRIDYDTGGFWGGTRLFQDGFATPDGRARFVPVQFRPAAEDICADYPVYLTTGRVLQHYQSGAQTRRVRDLDRAVPGPYVELHPDLAARLSVAQGDAVRVSSRRGSVTVPARITAGVRHDTVFMPFHWLGANFLTNPALDPISRMPELKVCAVRVEAARESGSDRRRHGRRPAGQ
ncbi:nitrite reductase [Nonomuraea sp. KC401]|uniref:Nitrite reductase n=1 Tax=Nonomuraea longispora TaxID=1848320 RepID=A0A4R4NIA3_9ACTN|nr:MULTISPECIES: molybdopterin oxidoreductase family protein [Nonomuraea]NBE96546.1 molybdopterin-dependent oxidoreductase [Nonomuraea sp. K271]TDC07157.1 nitrite reductase [Nonomuraea longispora]TLF86352.1 nitrite reductase [Nonomuraea sp. KC401]